MNELQKFIPKECFSWGISISISAWLAVPRPCPGGGGSMHNALRTAIVTMAAAIVTIANVVMAAVVEPQQSWP